MKEERVIAVNGLTKRYKKQFAVKEAGFAIKRGSICGLIGPNGAGKTTIMKMLGGLVLPTAGNISLYGGRSERELAKARERMSFMIEIPYAKLDLTAWQNLEKQRIQKGIPDKERPKKVMELVGLSDVGSKKLKEYSLGMKFWHSKCTFVKAGGYDSGRADQWAGPGRHCGNQGDADEAESGRRYYDSDFFPHIKRACPDVQRVPFYCTG